eukprot:GHVN01100269.1.p1 GENE.GHVN01100269.1~~GHVN01100269.1.p1  ORF type:complete len:415 (+),score=28.77 GHVN01100269.1:303-1547(+)
MGLMRHGRLGNLLVGSFFVFEESVEGVLKKRAGAFEDSELSCRGLSLVATEEAASGRTEDMGREWLRRAREASGVCRPCFRDSERTEEEVEIEEEKSTMLKPALTRGPREIAWCVKSAVFVLLQDISGLRRSLFEVLWPGALTRLVFRNLFCCFWSLFPKEAKNQILGGKLLISLFLLVFFPVVGSIAVPLMGWEIWKVRKEVGTGMICWVKQIDRRKEMKRLARSCFSASLYVKSRARISKKTALVLIAAFLGWKHREGLGLNLGKKTCFVTVAVTVAGCRYGRSFCRFIFLRDFIPVERQVEEDADVGPCVVELEQGVQPLLTVEAEEPVNGCDSGNERPERPSTRSWFSEEPGSEPEEESELESEQGFESEPEEESELELESLGFKLSKESEVEESEPEEESENQSLDQIE